MKKGILEMCILYQFLEKDYYGYDLTDKFKFFFPEVKDSSFYVILRRLHREGYLDIYYGDESSGPQRKYYKITERGREYLKNAVENWNKLKDIVEHMGIH